MIERKAIKYAQYLSGLFAYKHHATLVKGWVILDKPGQSETRYALFSNGQVLQSSPIEIWSSDYDTFAAPELEWNMVDHIPLDAVFTGHYFPP